ncbi:MAG TPA: tetratricopeptide repeat protein, partial [Acidocella sp.]|nr:tetratricopeptide repeat protein [Acidocella sp.]
RILQVQPKSAGDLNNRCWFLALDGKLTQALGYCQQALSLDPGNAATLDSTGFVYLKLKNEKQAISYYDQALKADPKLASSLYGRGLAEQAGGDADAAKADIALARQYDPKIEQEFGS